METENALDDMLFYWVFEGGPGSFKELSLNSLSFTGFHILLITKSQATVRISTLMNGNLYGCQ